jgi:predicted DCC family thiol-disulfide oxidoreductase YuxK
MITQKEKLRGWLYSLKEGYALDVRSLALMRIGLALVILRDLTWRFPDLTVFYSDEGVLPRTSLIDQFLEPWYWSIHLLSGQPFVQGLLFVSAILLALAMLVGYRTRLATIASWALIISIHHRNPALLFAGDSVLRTMMFWSMFLPLGAAYSFDIALNPKADSVPQKIFSGAVIALAVQQCFIYIMSAVFKTTSTIWWPDLTATYYALSFDQYVTPVGALLLNLPPVVLKFFTLVTLIIEWVGPLFLFFPYRTSLVRTITVITFVLLHLGFGLTLNIGIFPFLSISTWLAFIPTEVWEGWKKRFYGDPQAGLKIYYDADCGFCKKVVHLLRVFLLLPKTPLQTAQSEASIQEDMERWNSWVVVDWQDQRHFKFEAIAYVVSLSPIFRIFTPILRSNLMMKAGNRFYEAIANNRKTAGIFTSPLHFRSFTAPTPIWQSIVALLLLGLVFVLNLKGFTDNWAFVEKDTPVLRNLRRVTRSRSLQRVEWIGYLLRLDQGGWGIFAPAPPRDDGWHVIVGILEDGTEVNLLNPKQPISFDKPALGDRQKLYPNMQWRTYYINLNRNIGNKLYPLYGDYLCRQWQQEHRGKKPLKRIDFYFMEERTVDYGEPLIVNKQLQFEHQCQ